MPLQVHTAQIRYVKGKTPDALDVTRASGTSGIFLAPSWSILSPALDLLKRAKKLRDDAAKMPVEIRAHAEVEAHNLEWKTWAEYTFAYLAEMRASYKTNRRQWDELLRRDRVVLCCYCAQPNRCHRVILRQTILPKLGAIDCGEIEEKKRGKGEPSIWRGRLE